MNPVTSMTWLHRLGFLCGRVTKRNPIDRHRWSHQPETLEERALLSASAIAPDTTMDIAPLTARAAMTFPQVAGSWTANVVGQGSGTAEVTQDGATVTAAFDVPTLGNFVVKGHFSAGHPQEIVSRVRVTLPEIGRVRIRASLVFPEGEEPKTFTGNAQAKGKHHFVQNFAFTGTKQP